MGSLSQEETQACSLGTWKVKHSSLYNLYVLKGNQQGQGAIRTDLSTYMKPRLFKTITA